MQKTLFLYIFKDLLKVFLLASGALAGIMSFGGLLRPLTQHGLDLLQVGQMLGYFMPAMTNYSWPVAVLFATTFVYGRLSADNELTACRAAGLNYVQILAPAILIGIVVTLLSVLFLSFVVPRSFLKAERVVYSNLAKLVAGEIDRTQRLRLDAGGQQTTIFARAARVLDPDPAQPNLQSVELTGVTIVSYVKGNDLPKVPLEFYRAAAARADILMPDSADGDVLVRPVLVDGQKIPRPSTQRANDPRTLQRAVIGSSSAGPFVMASPVKETTRFMDVFRLLALREHPEQSRRVSRHIALLAQIDQQRAFLRGLRDRLAAGGPVDLVGRDMNDSVTYTIDPPPDALDATASPDAADAARATTRPAAPPIDVRLNNEKLTLARGTVDAPGIPFRVVRGGTAFAGVAREMTILAYPDADKSTVGVRVEARDVVLDYEGERTPLQGREWNVSVPMSPAVSALSARSARDYLADANQYSKDRVKALLTDVVRQSNQVESELHARCSFAFSCFLLALVGAMIGMMTRSGNFVSAFAVSVGPALIAIVLIVTGQHICESVPRVQSVHQYDDPLRVGLPILWSGNAIVLALGAGLYYKLSRT